MAITTLAEVKIIADEFTRAESEDPTSASVGVIGDIWLNNDPLDANYGATWELNAIVTVPSTSYTWTRLTAIDAKVTAKIARAEQDYLAIRGVPFDTDDNGYIDYPDGASDVAAEMVCYLLGLGVYEGRGAASESLMGRSVNYDAKIHGYPRSIVGTIVRYQSVV